MIKFRFHINERDCAITFEEFVSYFPNNEVRKSNLKTHCRSYFVFRKLNVRYRCLNQIVVVLHYLL